MAKISDGVGAPGFYLLESESNGDDKMIAEELRLLQSLPLEDKIRKSQLRVREWYDHWCGKIYISFSGGKDSTVLLHLVRAMYPDVPAVFADTGLEYPEIRAFVLQHENVISLRPAMNFRQVLEKYGYPVISKEQARCIHDIRHTKKERLRDIRLNGKVLADGRISTLGTLSARWRYLIDAPFKISSKCCHVLKKKPFQIYEKESGRHMMTGEMACEGRRRKTTYLKYGCNAFDLARPKSSPLGFWTDQDILTYLRRYKISYSSIYGDIVELHDGNLANTGCRRTGCMFCMFGAHLETGENRFIRMQVTHPQLWQYCIYTLGLGNILDYIGIPYMTDSETRSKEAVRKDKPLEAKK
jgi:3'-phosphoadenosine 5'-phosphosulfate sulfotransferase (PAPS reductase)/FAD synthetase